MENFKIVSLKVKDECPRPVFFRGNSPYSILIDISQFVGLELPSSGPTSILSVLRNQYPKGISIAERNISQIHDGRKTVVEYIEIFFDGEESREGALSTSFCIQGQDIKVIATINLTDCNIYRIKISNIQLLDNPSSFKSDVHNHLQLSGNVESLHLHYTNDGNWFTGNACAFWKGSPTVNNRRFTSFPFEYDSKLSFSISKLSVNE